MGPRNPILGMNFLTLREFYEGPYLRLRWHLLADFIGSPMDWVLFASEVARGHGQGCGLRIFDEISA